MVVLPQDPSTTAGRFYPAAVVAWETDIHNAPPLPLARGALSLGLPSPRRGYRTECPGFHAQDTQDPSVTVRFKRSAAIQNRL